MTATQRSQAAKGAAILILLTVAYLIPVSAQTLQELTELKPGRNFRASSTNKDWRTSNVDFVPILPGKTLTLADVKGPGTIRRIWLTILPSEPEYSRLMTLRIYWDGEKSPSVECPLGDFFGAGHGVDKIVNSIPVRASADGRARSCYWVMPFKKSARITVTNEGTLATWGFYYQVDGVYEPIKSSAAYFHASYRQAFPTRPGNFVIADIKGNGQYVGSVVSVRSTAEGWFGEGNDYFYVDGESEPSLKGTGFEDYFGEAWALREANGAYAGCSLFEGGFVGARATCYRWHIPDPIRFNHSLRVEIQHMGVGQNAKGEWVNNIERTDEYSSVAFWYQLGSHDPYPALPPGADRLSFDYRRFVEAESLHLNSPRSGFLNVVKANGLHGDADLEWTNAEDGADLDIPFAVPSAGPYQVMVLVARKEDGGIGRFYVDGQPISDPISFFNPNEDSEHELALEMRPMAAGKHVLTLRCLGKPQDAKDGKRFAIDGFIVQPLRK